jgi:hypothetical protein
MKKEIREMIVKAQKKAKRELDFADAFKSRCINLGIWEEVKQQLIKQNELHKRQ